MGITRLDEMRSGSSLIYAMKHSEMPRLLKHCSALIVLVMIVGALPIRAGAQTTTFKIPPVKIPLDIKDQEVSITVSGLVSRVSKRSDLNLLKVELTADLSNLQQNLTGLLSSELDKDDRCGDRIAIQRATLTAIDPAGLAIVQLHYERWVCAKLFGKQQSQKVIGGNAMIQMKLTPSIDASGTELQLVAEVGPIEADGSLGELLRKGALGDSLHEKIRTAIMSAIQKGTSLKGALPPAIQGYTTLQNAKFTDAGSGRLLVILGGDVRITDEQIAALTKQVKERVGSR